TQIKILFRTPFDFFDLPENRIGTQSSVALRGVVKGINGREAIIKEIDHCNANQLPITAKLNKSSEMAAIDQKRTILISRGWIHVAVAVALSDVAFVHLIMLFTVTRHRNLDL